MIEDFQDLFEKMVCYDPNERINIEDVVNHPWFKGYKEPIFASDSNEEENKTI